MDIDAKNAGLKGILLVTLVSMLVGATPVVTTLWLFPLIGPVAVLIVTIPFTISVVLALRKLAPNTAALSAEIQK